MKKSNDFVLSFFGLKEGKHVFEYKIDKQFFEFFGFDEFLDADFKVVLEFVKKSTLLELYFSSEGVATVACDVTNEPFELPIEGALNLVVKFGEEFNNDNEEVLILPHGEHQLDLSQYIYEMIALAVPQKKLHPGIEDGSLQSDILKKLEELSPDKNKEVKDIDPRWDDLKKLLIDKKK
ncbi:MAG: DUF177 domain-containing protein [Flavobacteriaceae bacterium]|nr:MAG: DUF177 domain-containing protein [Flavobacteriaceae bacterium]